MSKINRNEPPLFEVDGKAVLTGLRRGDKLGRYAILAVRDPLGFSKDAADVIADSMTDVREITRNSMFTVLSGCYQDAQIIVCSTGSGGAARSLRYHVGITRSNDAIYCGQGRPVMGYLPNEGVVEHWVNAGVLNVERETAAILTLAQLFHARGGSICTVCNSSITQKVGVSQGIDDAIAVGLEGLALLARRDAEKERAGQKWWSPHCG